MSSLSKLGIALTTVSALLLLALMAEIYYLLHYRKKRTAVEIQGQATTTRTRNATMAFLCFKPQAKVVTSAAPVNGDCHVQIHHGDQDEVDMDDVDVEEELRRLHSLAGPPRLLFTIREETGEELESDDGGGRRRDRRSLHDLIRRADSPLLTPLSSPPVLHSAIDSCCKFNPLFETTASPPPKFKFLRDAEEKMCRRAAMEEAVRSESSGHGDGDDEGAFITIVVNKSRERGGHHHCHPLGSSSQVTPLAASPSDTKK